MGMHYDLIIVGGGPIGAGLAIALKQLPLRIALIEARSSLHEDPRLFALNDSSCQFLKHLGVWEKLVSHAAPICKVHVSYQGHPGAIRLRNEEVGLASLGHVIPANHINIALNEALSSVSNVTRYCPATLMSLNQVEKNPTESQVTLSLQTETGEEILQSSMVIGADGSDSTVRAHLNMTTEKLDYQQSAIVTRTLLKRSHRHVAYERFYAKGAIAMLPLVTSEEGDECATIWTADRQTIAELMARSDEAFLQALQKEFGFQLGRLLRIKQRHVFPLHQICAEETVEGGVLLLGNAAHTLHPIAAQGLNLAFYEVALLVENILTKDLKYISKQMRKQQAISTNVSHRLSQWFSSDSRWMHVAWPLGAMGCNTFVSIKKKFIQHILGRTGYVPSLLLSE